MKSFLSKWPITCIAGILHIMISFTFITIAYILFPGPFSMFNNTASTLGNHSLNPNGAILFRLSNIIGGALLFPFFLGLYEWKRDDKWSKISLNLTIILGCFIGFGAVYLININDPAQSILDIKQSVSVFIGYRHIPNPKFN